MIPPGWVLLRVAFTKVCCAEAKLHGNGPHIAPQAAGRLLYLLINGRLKTRQFGSENDISTEYWKNRAESFARDILSDAFPGIVVNENELQLVEADRISVAEPTPNSPQTKRGRKPAADPYAIAWIVGSIVYEDVRTRSQEDMYAEIAKRYEAEFGAGQAPSRTTLQPMIRRWFTEMKKHDAEIDKLGRKAGK